MLELVTTFFLMRRDTRGVTALEYGLIAALIAGVIVAAVGTLGTDISSTFTTLAGKLTPAAG